MENTRCDSIEEVDDISARNEYKVALAHGLSPAQAMESVNRFSRDNARTPFQWDDTANAGFTSGTPWLKVNPNYREINLAAQENDPDSVWNFYRALTALRSNPAYRETVVYGETRPYMPNRKNLMAYFRRGEKQTLLVMGNYQAKGQRVRLPGKVKKVLLNNLNEFDVKDGVFKMGPWQFAVLEMK